MALLLTNYLGPSPRSPLRRYAYDWDNVFYPLNLLLAQETDRSTFRERSEQFLRNWICVSAGRGSHDCWLGPKAATQSVGNNFHGRLSCHVPGNPPTPCLSSLACRRLVMPPTTPPAAAPTTP